ncbi:MAG TPA: tetratricopeptide repeat protein, partial [Segetibacter sp.]|nr:tetratricopeptide repeat protein [Segetibacter sp.]
ELAIWYYNAGCKSDAAKVLELAPTNAEVLYWRSFLENKALNFQQLRPEFVFPFRTETAEVLKELIKQNDNWLLKYHLALIEWNYNNIESAKQLFQACGNAVTYAPFYAARAKFNMKNDSSALLHDLQQARKMDKNQWRYGRNLINYYLSNKQYNLALQTAKEYQNQFKGNFVLDMLYAKTLLVNKNYKEVDNLLKTIQILPNEGATGGRQLYKETELMLAIEEMKNNNYDKALQYITSSRLWPENLGVGKPYEEDIDERLEDWLAYESYSKQGNAVAAKKMLDKILSKSPGMVASVNNLISAWALQKTGKHDQAKKLLSEWVEKDKNNALAHWAINVYNGENKNLPENIDTNENYRILNQLINLKL